MDTVLLTEKRCFRCDTTKPTDQFSKRTKSRDGLNNQCRACDAAYHKKTAPARYQKKKEHLRMKIRPVLEDQPDKIKSIVRCFLENPKSTYEEVAILVGLKRETIASYCSQNEYLRALRALASSRLSSFLPLAIQGYKDSLESKDQDVKLRASIKLLENENIMGPTKVDITVNDLRSWSADQLKAVIEQGKDVPLPTIEAELIS